MHIIKNKPAIIKWLQISCLTMASVLVFYGRAQATTVPAEPAQETTTYEELHGHVIDSEGEALAGATVRLKGSQTGTSTNVDGNFTLRVPADDKSKTLIISFVGMLTQEVKVKNPAERILVKLQDDATVLSEVVVTGMDVIKKEHMTGSASVIQAKDLRMQGITSIDRILEGKVAGLNSSTISGAPGSRAKITIRGENNLNGNSEPLWIVDGLPMTQGVPTSNTGNYAGTIMQDGVGNIMPEDIESISILKDASAAAIYGARAANGVIVITTKKGFRSKTQVSYTGTYEISLAPSSNLDFMNSAEKLQYEKSIIDNFGLKYAYLTGRGGYSYKRMVNGFITPKEYESEINRLSQINTDWFDVLFRTAHSNSHNVSLRGGTDEITYYTSVNIQQKEGILMSNKYQSAGLLMKLDYRPVKDLIVALNVSANTRKNRDNASAIDPFTYAMFANPYEQPYDAYGNYSPDLSYLSNNYTTERSSGYVYDQFNIVREMKDTRSKQDGSDVEFTLDLRYQIIPGLTVESIYRHGISYNTSTTEVEPGTYTSMINEPFASAAYKYYNILPQSYDNGHLSENSGKNYSWAWRNQIDYSFDINKDHMFSILLASEIMSKKYTNFGYTSPIYYGDYRITGIPTFNKDVLYEDMISAISQMFNTNDGQDRSVSFLGSLRYGFKDRYIVNFNYRTDGADVIGNKNRFTPLWSVGLRYNLHKEAFFPKNNILNELSIRGSYGLTGNIDRSAYPFSTLSYGNMMYMGNRFATSFTYPNPTVGWEKKTDRNLGLDVALFNHRLSFNVDYYFNETKDILETLDVPASTGRTTVKANGGIVENKGLEIFTNIQWFNNRDWTFGTSFNIAMNKNVIKKSYYDYDSYQDMIKNNVSQGGVLNIIGQETGSIYGWKFAGVNPATGNPRYYLTEEGRRAYGAFLDKWDSYTDEQKERYLAMIGGDTKNVPDIVDFVRDQNRMDYLLPSMQYLGRTNPKFVGGFNTYLRWKGLEFSTSWTFKTGHIIPNFNDYQNAPNNEASAQRAALGYSSDLKVSATNRERKYLNYWQFPGDITNVPRFTTNDNDYWASLCTSDRYSKGDYLRMTNLSVSYRFPSSLIRNWAGMKNLSIGVNARNLLTFTKYRGLDVGSGGAFTYPVAREINFRLTVGF